MCPDFCVSIRLAEEYMVFTSVLNTIDIYVLSIWYVLFCMIYLQIGSSYSLHHCAQSFRANFLNFV